VIGAGPQAAHGIEKKKGRTENRRPKSREETPVKGKRKRGNNLSFALSLFCTAARNFQGVSGKNLQGGTWGMFACKRFFIL
jgi:hypothetical protein